MPLHMDSAPSCDHFGRHGKWKKYLGLKFWRKSPIGDQQIKRETYLKYYQDKFNQYSVVYKRQRHVSFSFPLSSFRNLT